MFEEVASRCAWLEVAKPRLDPFRLTKKKAPVSDNHVSDREHGYWRLIRKELRVIDPRGLVQLVELAKHKSVSNKGIFFRALYLIHVGLSIDLRQINEHHNDCLLRLSRFGGWGNVEKEALVIVD